ncbi:hypothetical protein LJC71_02510 [Desulfosarcina sp. OttesenSCG-928-A07]|nr:hypothetical protein [Desulfosarcina sp. OttesenSCG-928-G17]MDL2328609.1 hypothetical protein [Desulfosarcina sp. OttesenSCG-928-A07]
MASDLSYGKNLWSAAADDDDRTASCHDCSWRIGECPDPACVRSPETILKSGVSAGQQIRNLFIGPIMITGSEKRVRHMPMVIRDKQFDLGKITGNHLIVQES